VGLVSR